MNYQIDISIAYTTKLINHEKHENAQNKTTQADLFHLLLQTAADQFNYDLAFEFIWCIILSHLFNLTEHLNETDYTAA